MPKDPVKQLEIEMKNIKLDPKKDPVEQLELKMGIITLEPTNIEELSARIQKGNPRWFGDTGNI